MPSPTDIVSTANAERPFFLGVDVGGTNIKVGVLDNQGHTVGRMQIPTDEERGVADAMRRSKTAADELLNSIQVDWDEVAAVGLGTPGSMDISKGLILQPPNMPTWRNYPIVKELSEACGKPVSYANDANAAAYGEYWIGGARDFNSMIMLTLGTGVGGGIIYEGVSIDGANSFGSECGHMYIDSSPDARLCVWGGGKGQLEAYASASAVVARAQEALDAGRRSSLNDRVDRAALTSLMIYEEAEAGDELSMEIILETARYLAIGVTTLVHIIDPGVVILGGAMDFGGNASQTGRRFIAEVRREFKRLAYHSVADTTTIDYAILGGHAGYIRAAGIARTAWLKQNAATGRAGNYR